MPKIEKIFQSQDTVHCEIVWCLSWVYHQKIARNNIFENSFGGSIWPMMIGRNYKVTEKIRTTYTSYDHLYHSKIISIVTNPNSLDACLSCRSVWIDNGFRYLLYMSRRVECEIAENQYRHSNEKTPEYWIVKDLKPMMMWVAISLLMKMTMKMPIMMIKNIPFHMSKASS